MNLQRQLISKESLWFEIYKLFGSVLTQLDDNNCDNLERSKKNVSEASESLGCKFVTTLQRTREQL